MRVIAGAYRGRRLRVPRGDATRPTSDRVREALYGVLGDVEGLRVLDLFAGSGGMGIEALSRGAERAVFVEQRRATLAVLQRNLRELELAARSVVVAAPVGRSGKRLATEGPFDLVVADPPYDMVSSGRLVTELRAAARPNGFWRPGAVIVVEHRSKDDPPALDEALGAQLEETRRYGGTSITIYRWPDEL